MDLAPPPAPTRAEIDALADRIATVSAQATILEHARLSDLRRFDELRGWGHQGARTCAHWLSWKVSMDLQTAREHVRVARALGSLPKIDAALRATDLTYSKVRAM